jgi:hypothetical protein
MANGMFKMKMDIDRHSPRLMPNNCQHLDPLYFSLPTTFNASLQHKKGPELKREIKLFENLAVNVISKA